MKQAKAECVIRCSIALIDSAVKISGSGNGMRITIDIPQSELINALPLIALTQKPIALHVYRDSESIDLLPNKAQIE